MINLYDEMAKRESAEAKVYKANDSLEALIQHNISDLSTWISNEYELNKTYADDKDAVPLFNSDNCVNGFYYTSIEEMKDTIAFWKREYQNRYYVRWAIIDKNANCAIGTIELFNRKAKDYFNDCGLLRLDLRSDYEKQDIIEDILGLIIPETRDMFACEMIATKAISIAKERIKALEHKGFCLSEESVIGHDGTKYNSYYVREV